MLRKIRLGDANAFDALIPLMYDELKHLAASHLQSERQPLQATELVHEVFLKLQAMEHPDYESRSHFYGIASHLMRQILVDLARARLAKKRGAGREITVANIEALCGAQSDARLLDLNEALQRLEKEHPRKARLVEMRYFGGMTAEDSAVAVQIPVHTVRRELRFAEAWLKRELSS